MSTNTHVPDEEEVTASELNHGGDGEHDTDFTETSSKGGTTTRERNASNKKTQVIALIFGAIIIVMIAGFAYLKFFAHPQMRHNAMPHMAHPVVLGPHGSLDNQKPELSGTAKPEANPLSSASTYAPVTAPSLPAPALPLASKAPVVAQTPQAPVLPAPEKTPEITLPTASAPSAPVAPASATSLPTPASASTSAPASANAQEQAMAALMGTAPAKASTSSQAPVSSASAPNLPVAPEIKSASDSVLADIKKDDASPASASSVSTPVSVDAQSTTKKPTTPNSEAIALLNQISDQIHGIKDQVDSQDVEIQTLKDRVAALEEKVASGSVKVEHKHVEKREVYSKPKNSVELVSSSHNSVALVSLKPEHKWVEHKKVVKEEPKVAVDDNAPKTVTGFNVPGGVCAGLSRGRVWIRRGDGSFQTLGIGDKLGGKTISSVSLTDGVTAGNITYTCH